MVKMDEYVVAVGLNERLKRKACVEREGVGIK
jgi:hypothetical protein